MEKIEERALNNTLPDEVSRVLRELAVSNPRQALAVEKRFREGLTYEAIAGELGVTTERARQVTLEALYQLRMPKFAKRLVDYWEDE